MSNGNRFEYTTEEKATLFAQFAKSQEFANEGKRPFETVSRSLQAIISPDTVVSFSPKVSVDGDGIKTFHVVGNFASLSDAVTAGDYNDIYGELSKPEKIPHIVHPVDQKVKAVPLGKTTTLQEIYDSYPRMASLMTLFTLGSQCKEEQREAPILIVWKDAFGRFWYAILDGYGSDRYALARRSGPDGGFGGRCRVLVCE